MNQTQTATPRRAGSGDAIDELVVVLLPETHSYRFGFQYPGLFGRPVVTDLLICAGGPKPLVVATEREDNPGASITNTIEKLAEAIAGEYGWHADDFVLVEHYIPGRYGSAQTRDPFERSLALVTFEREWSGPKWQHVTLETLAAAVRAAGGAR